MSGLTERGESRRQINARKRISRRPSRLGIPAGTVGPDREFDPEAGFPGLLKRAWQRAGEAADLRSFVEVLLTLDGHVPADIQLRALTAAEEAALHALCGLSWGTAETDTAAPSPAAEDIPDERPGGDDTAFLGEIGLSTSGRILLRVPSQGPLKKDDLVGGVRRVPWTSGTLRAYQQRIEAAEARLKETAADCRRWLDEQGPEGRDELLAQAREAALRNAPFVLYQQERQYTNFREANNLTGKTLWPGHPDCVLSSLHGLPLDLWSDHDVQLIVCLTLLIRSAGFGRVEEANGTQLTVDHVAHMLERIRRGYNGVPGGTQVPPAAAHTVAALNDLAVALRSARAEAGRGAQLYREIHGALMHKIERVAQEPGERTRALEEAMVARLTERLPLTGTTLHELGEDLAAAPDLLATPLGGYGTGLEHLVHETVAAVTDVFEADFAMSRGMRSLPALIEALREERWPEICDWDITRFFCCVVPHPSAVRHFGGSAAALADAAWAMSSRMQYNSWHFIAGNLPRTDEVAARDHFVPPVIPDVAFYSDQHHHGHVNNKVRFSIRSPQAVEVDGRVFNGFIDLRLLRCAGTPFGEQDLLAVHRVSALVARATGLAATLAAAGTPIEVTAFDSPWHWSTVAGDEPAEAPTAAGPARRAS
ncbi:hypothetical protein [Streptomyces lancefieldiae]|uniref:Uncharacterized protein n=1 Tax=Streptomyces lancefieldiae TaxID=3075520 RepID=A0ABU3AV44_9ACTN|nr:hypothetical protein [Streptomyces sp. DSM 40712]MDT0612691.1 hypothetical protein [Streptomyces sp. DSM 40712]